MHPIANRVADRRIALTPIETVWYSDYPKVLHTLMSIEQSVRKAKAEAEAGFLAHKTSKGDMRAELRAAEGLQNAVQALKGVPSLDDLNFHIVKLHQDVFRASQSRARR